jgi:hypothetical protein
MKTVKSPKLRKLGRERLARATVGMWDRVDLVEAVFAALRKPACRPNKRKSK